MPLMKRLSKKAQEVAFSILGVPPNMRSKPTKEQKRINQVLMAQHTRRVR